MCVIVLRVNKNGWDSKGKMEVLLWDLLLTPHTIRFPPLSLSYPPFEN